MLVALFAALLCVTSVISIPIAGIPVTLQTFTVSASLFILGGARGTAAICVYVALGLLGLPVFSGFNGGIGALVGPTGGFIIGFVLSGVAYLCLSAIFKNGRAPNLLFYAAGHAFMYAVGAFWYALAYGGEASFWSVLSVTVFPFLLPDALKVASAYLLSVKLKKHLKF